MGAAVRKWRHKIMVIGVPNEIKDHETRVGLVPAPLHGTPAQRANGRRIGGDAGIHWPDLDEDISADGLLAGRRSGETQESLWKWLQARKAG